MNRTVVRDLISPPLFYISIAHTYEVLDNLHIPLFARYEKWRAPLLHPASNFSPLWQKKPEKYSLLIP